MRIIRVSEETWQLMAKLARPFEKPRVFLERTVAEQAVKAGITLQPPAVADKTPKRKVEWRPLEWFREPLLVAMAELGGRARVGEVRQLLERKLGGLLRPGDHKPVSAGGPRWWHRVQWNRLRLIHEGFFQKGSDRGVWELSKKGKALAKKLLTRDPKSG